MTVTTTVWVVSLAVAALILAFDLWTVARRPHEPSHREALSYLGVYIGLAVLFGVGLWVVSGSTAAGEFYAGWITEYSLSVDNLFVFLLIMRAFAVPQRNQQTALLVGIVLALVLRGIVIVVGGVAIEHLSWVFYIFGAFLIWTAITVGRSSSDEDEEYEPPLVVRLFRRWVPSTPDYQGVRLTVRRDGRRLATPMLMVLVALGVTDLLFALDSIPAVFGVTKVPYLVLMANVFALMGLRQLYFLLGGLLTRLVYLNIGLAVLLGFIGVKLVLEALHQNALGFINGGQPVSWAPELSAGTSLAVIVAVLVVTAAASLLRERRTASAEV